jgi:hypothetical protein
MKKSPQLLSQSPVNHEAQSFPPQHTAQGGLHGHLK